METVKKEERRTRRRPLQATAAAALDGRHLFNCRIVDFSEAGARIEVRDHEAPDRFQLIDIEGGMVFSVRVAWRRGRMVGVAFLHTRAVDEAPEWIVALWRHLRAEQAGIGRSAA